MQADNLAGLKKAVRLLEKLSTTARTIKALGLLREELDEIGAEGITQDEVLRATKGQVEEIRPARRGKGSYVRQKVKCGDPTCHCAKDAGDYHGPYWYLFTKKDGKARSKYLGKNLPSKASS
jgi:hypothetical protein